MSDATERSLLPVALEPFEEYMVRDERPGYPMVFPLILEFQGRIDRSAMAQAFRQVLGHEPLLTARLGRCGRNWQWIACQRLPELVWEDGPVGGAGDVADFSVRRGHVFDLREEPGLRAQVRVHSNQVTFTCYFHHACTDGLGAFHFVANWLACYGRLIGDGEGLDARLPMPELALRRADLGVVFPQPVTRSQIARGALVEACRWLVQRPSPLATNGARVTKARMSPELVFKRLDAVLVDQLRRCAIGKQARLNDLLLRDMFLTIRDWNARFQPVSARQHMRILVPTNLRKMKHRRMPAANLLGYAFLTRKMRDCDRPDDLLVGIRDEVRYIRDWSLGAMFVGGVGIFRRIPCAVPLLTSKRFCHATCVVSNLGRLHRAVVPARFRREQTFRVGDLRLLDLFGAPPVRPRTWASMAVIAHQDRLCLAANVDLNSVPRDHAIGFLKAYCDRLAETGLRVEG